MSSHRVASRIALVCALGLGTVAAGCADRAQVFADNNETWFSRPMNVFNKPDWARPASGTAELGPSGPVGPDDLVGPDGRCGAPAETAQASAPQPAEAAQGDRPVGSVAGDLAGAPMPAGRVAVASPGDNSLGGTGAPQVTGGIALGMTECQAVRRGGTPGNVAISAGDRGDRAVVLTYLSGPWPGIYRFSDGRLKVIDRAPAPPEPPKKKPKKQAAKPKATQTR